jgi:carotenoid cleavage dioxygenase-like enzyme
MDRAPSLVRIADGRVETLDLGPDTCACEPVVAVDAEGHPWVLSHVYDGRAERSFVAVIDAERWGDGPVARCWFDHALPFSFHGAWAGAAPGEGARR